jgi:AraC-like DNA-binding protein
MHPEARRCWRLVERLAESVAVVHRWTGLDAEDADGEYHVIPTLVACLDGVVRVERGRERVDLGPNEVLLIAGGVRHTHAPLRPGSAVFGQGFMASWSDVVIATASYHWTGRLAMQPSRTLMERALAADPGQPRAAAVQAVVREVLDESVDELRLAHPAVRAMLGVLWRRLHTGITADDLVLASGLGRSQAWAVFTAAYGVTPRQAIVQGRLWLAEQLVAEGLPVAEVARRCGFAGPDVFTRAWKRVHGTTPTGRQTGRKRSDDR